MTTPLDALRQLDAALADLAGGLIGFTPDPVLRAEELVAAAVTALANARGPVDDPAALRAAIVTARESLFRCRALGRSAVAIANGMLQQPGYDRRGTQLGAPAAARRATVV